MSSRTVASSPERQLAARALPQINPACADEEIRACFAVMKVLRPHLHEASFLSQIHAQQAQGYRLVCIRDENRVVTAGGYRITDFLAWGRVLYVDDLVTDPAREGLGFGGAMMDWLLATARQEQCAELHLDSGYQRHAAHRLYLNKGLQLNCHHFSIKIAESNR